jgi:hypothetical protein
MIIKKVFYWPPTPKLYGEPSIDILLILKEIDGRKITASLLHAVIFTFCKIGCVTQLGRLEIWAHFKIQIRYSQAIPNSAVSE